MIGFESSLVLVLNVFISFTSAAISQSEVPLLKVAPKWLNPCRKKSNDLNDCLRNTFDKMFPHLANGIPEIGMEPFEPMHIDYVGIKKGQGPVTLAGSFKNLKVYGPSNTSSTYTRFDLQNNKLDIGLFIPIIKVDATYDLKGKLLLLPLVGVGHAKLHLKNVSTNVQTDIFFPKTQGEEVMVASSMKVDFSLASMRVYLDNLFNGNKVLGKSVNQFMNQNALLVVEELKETIGENLAVVFKKVMNDAFSHIPTKLWLMDDVSDNTNTKDTLVKNITEAIKTEIKNQNTSNKEIKNNIKSSTVKANDSLTSTTTARTTIDLLKSTTLSAATSTTTQSTIDSETDLIESSTDEILEETEESRSDREESESTKSESNNQLDQLQSETNNLNKIKPSTSTVTQENRNQNNKRNSNEKKN